MSRNKLSFDIKRFQSGLLVLLNRAADAIEGSPRFCQLLIAGCFLLVAIVQAHNKLLLSDELYTWHISRAPTVRDMLSLSREIDLHPPLHYLAQRMALLLPVNRWLASRLPSILAGLVVSLSLYRFTARRMGRLYGVVAAAIFWFSPALDFAWSNRPYMLWLAFLCLLLLARDVAVSPKRSAWALLAVLMSSLGMVSTHMLGVACMAPFLAAEILRSRSRRRVDWLLVLALCAPAVLVVGFLYQLHHMSSNAFPLSQSASVSVLRDVYIHLLGNAAMMVSILVLGLAVLFPVSANESTVVRKLIPANARSLTTDEVTVLLGLLLMPILLMAAAAVFHLQFWGRYGAAAIPALAVLGAWFIATRLPLARPLAVCLVVAGVAYMAYVMVADTLPQSNAGELIGGRLPIPLSTLDPSLPIVVASPMTFVEMSDREPPAITARVFYLTDTNAAYRYAHYTLFENEEKVRSLLDLPSHAEPLSLFLSSHPRFYMVGDYNAPQIWLPRDLGANGFNLDYLGKFESSYESDDLYLVSR